MQAHALCFRKDWSGISARVSAGRVEPGVKICRHFSLDAVKNRRPLEPAIKVGEKTTSVDADRAEARLDRKSGGSRWASSQ